MQLSNQQRDRAAGVLLGQAVGDALGVPYEFGDPVPAGAARMVGRGLGPYAPGEWSDDTQMALCIARVAAGGLPLWGDEALDEVASAFLEWRMAGATDVGIQTAGVLSRVRRGQEGLGRRMTEVSEQLARPGSAGNGALMRTAVVGISALGDPRGTAESAKRVARLTHADERCVESAVLWSEAVRVAVNLGVLDIRSGLRLIDPGRRGLWEGWIDEAENGPPARFRRNGYTVTALQAAWSAIWATRQATGPEHFEDALQTAISIGHDTDTVAAIAGGLLGARHGVSGIPADLARRVLGWPGLRSRDLVGLGLTIVSGGSASWQHGRSMLCGTAKPLAVAHPQDGSVLLGTEADLARCRDLGVTAVVSLSRIGTPELRSAGVDPGNHAEIWLVDSDDPVDNSNLAWTIADAARTVAAFRAQGERVLVHCVHAHHRTPAVALSYSRLLGVEAGEAARRIEAVIGHPVDGLLWQVALDGLCPTPEQRA